MNLKKQVRETKAGKSISAWVILKGKKLVATVHAHYSDSGIVTVDVWDPYTIVYQGRADGYGYDKLTAAMTGAVIDGVEITDNCGGDRKLPRGKKVFPKDMKAPKGYYFVNYSTEHDGWTSCYRTSGLDVLEAYGYVVHQVI